MHNTFQKNLRIVPVAKGNVVRLDDHRPAAAQPARVLDFIEVRDRHGRFQGIEARWTPISRELRGRVRMMAEGSIR